MHRLLLLVLLAACVPHPVVASAPRPFAASMDVAGDTVRVGAAACQVGAPTVACRVTLSGTVGATPIVFAPVADLALGQSVTVSAAVTCTNLAPVSVTISSRGLNAAGVLSAATSATGTATCPAGAPNQPGVFTVTVTVGP